MSIKSEGTTTDTRADTRADTGACARAGARTGAITGARTGTPRRGRPGRATALAAVGAAGSLAVALLAAAGPVQAQESAAGAGAVAVAVAAGSGSGTGGPAKACVPAIRVLKSLPGTGVSRVNAFGSGKLAVGASQDLPVYWTGRQIHRVPLPSGYVTGTVDAVNRSGLMVGSLRTAPAGGTSAAFSYRPGAHAVRLLPGGDRATGVNDHGHIVGERDGAEETVTGLEWVGGHLRRELPLPADHELAAVSDINEAGQITGSGSGIEEELYWFSAGLVWPAAATALPKTLDGYYPGDTYDEWTLTGIDDRGRIVGNDWYARDDVTSATTWASSEADETPVPFLGDRTGSSLDGISPTTDVMVGTALDSYIVGPWPPDTAPPVQAQIWPGSGPMLALPRLAPDGASRAYAVTDDQRVGGSAADASAVSRAVVWTCALEQAYVPGPDAPGAG